MHGGYSILIRTYTTICRRFVTRHHPFVDSNTTLKAAALWISVLRDQTEELLFLPIICNISTLVSRTDHIWHVGDRIPGVSFFQVDASPIPDPLQQDLRLDRVGRCVAARKPILALRIKQVVGMTYQYTSVS
jgi:hypothetical protein